jgi:hypothetical protein
MASRLRRLAVQYAATIEYLDGKITGQGEILKFTHTWMKVNGQWQIIGGMCGVLKPTE